jgi:tRNA(fMet)-specific endonuclease VapC
MLDTDICSYVMKRSHPGLLQRLAATSPDEVCISVITLLELHYGVAVSPRREQNSRALEEFLRYVQVMELTEEIAEHYASVRASLKRRGSPIGARDLLIGAHARALNLILVTNNMREFSRIEELKVENWTVLPPA